MTDQAKNLRQLIKQLVTEAFNEAESESEGQWVVRASDDLGDMFHGIMGWTDNSDEADKFASKEEAEKALATVKQSDPYPDAEHDVLELV